MRNDIAHCYICFGVCIFFLHYPEIYIPHNGTRIFQHFRNIAIHLNIKQVKPSRISLKFTSLKDHNLSGYFTFFPQEIFQETRYALATFRKFSLIFIINPERQL